MFNNFTLDKEQNTRLGKDATSFGRPSKKRLVQQELGTAYKTESVSCLCSQHPVVWCRDFDNLSQTGTETKQRQCSLPTYDP